MYRPFHAVRDNVILLGGAHNIPPNPPAAPTPEPHPLKVGVICTKYHELEGFKIAVRDAVRSHQWSGRVVEPLPEHKGGYELLRWQFGPSQSPEEQWELLAVTFGVVQGPVEAAARTAQFVVAERPKLVGMVGICGGQVLGQVVLATTAIAADAGRFQRGAAGYALNPRDGDGNWAHQTRTSDAVVTTVNSFLNSCSLRRVPLGACHGTLYSYSQVRDDLVNLGIPPTAGVDMEAYAFFHTIALMSEAYDVKALPVVKGVSDVGIETLLERDQQHFSPTNLAELRKYVPAFDPDRQDNSIARRQYRSEAGKRAASVMVEFITFALNA